MELSGEIIYCEVCNKEYPFETTCIHITEERLRAFKQVYERQLAKLSKKPTTNKLTAARRKTTKDKR